MPARPWRVAIAPPSNSQHPWLPASGPSRPRFASPAWIPGGRPPGLADVSGSRHGCRTRKCRPSSRRRLALSGKPPSLVTFFAPARKVARRQAKAFGFRVAGGRDARSNRVPRSRASSCLWLAHCAAGANGAAGPKGECRRRESRKRTRESGLSRKIFGTSVKFRPCFRPRHPRPGPETAHSHVHALRVCVDTPRVGRVQEGVSSAAMPAGCGSIR